MRDRVRQPLFWLVVAEVLVMFALFWVSWRVYSAHRPAPVSIALPAPPLPSASPVTAAVPLVPPPAPSPGPAASAFSGLIGFPVDLGQLNRDQAELEKLEDSILTRMVEAASGYLETVVLPAVRRAESVNSTTRAAAPQSPAATRKMP